MLVAATWCVKHRRALLHVHGRHEAMPALGMRELRIRHARHQRQSSSGPAVCASAENSAKRRCSEKRAVRAANLCLCFSAFAISPVATIAIYVHTEVLLCAPAPARAREKAAESSYLKGQGGVL